MDETLMLGIIYLVIAVNAVILHFVRRNAKIKVANANAQLRKCILEKKDAERSADWARYLSNEAMEMEREVRGLCK